MRQHTLDVAARLPTLVQFVITINPDGRTTFGFLTQGRPRTTLPETLRSLLCAILRIHLDAKGMPTAAQQIIDIFRLTFPDLERLREFDPTASAMMLACPGHRDHAGLKLYLNTRMGAGAAHEKTLEAILKTCALYEEAFFRRFHEHLYTGDARFYGIGLDIEAPDERVDPSRQGYSPIRRAKLYVHVPMAQLDQLKENLCEMVGGGEAAKSLEQEVQASRRLLDAFEPSCLSNHLEVGIAIQAGEVPKAKFVVFFNNNEAESTATAGLVAYLKQLGQPTSGITTALTDLGEDTLRGVVFPRALFGVGVESNANGKPRVNIYMRPVI